jgi:hypothetical protein
MNVSGPGCVITEDMLAVLTLLIQKCVSSKQFSHCVTGMKMNFTETPRNSWGLKLITF